MSSTSVKLYADIADKDLPDLLRKYFGKDVNLVSWGKDKFVVAGENYLGKVEGIVVKVSDGTGKTYDIRFIVKLNPRRPLELFQKTTQSFFVKEGKFFTDVTPKLNEILAEVNISPISVPKCYYVSLKQNEEIILLQDMRPDGYTTENRHTPISEDRITLVLAELAKLHASSYIYLSKLSEEEFTSEFAYMKDMWLYKESPGSAQYLAYCSARFTSVLEALKGVEGYEKVQKWLEKEEKNLFKYFVEGWFQTTNQFRVICHGDIWTSNILFKTGTDTSTDSTLLIDFQQCRVASLITDIYILLVTSAAPDVRRTKLDLLLNSYYKNFSSILISLGIPLPFTEAELKDQYMSKIVFGFLCGIVRLPLLLSEDDDVFDMETLCGENFSKFLAFEKQKATKLLTGDENKRKRFLSIFEAALERNFFD